MPPAGAPIKTVGRLPRRRAERAARRPRREGVRRAGLYPRHGARRHGACPRRAPAAPRRDDRRGRRGRDPPRRERADRDRPRRQFPRDPRRRRDGRRSRRRRSRPSHVAWDGVEPINPFQEEARWLLQQPSIDRIDRRAACRSGAAATAGTRRPIRGCTSPTPRWRRPAGSRSTATGGSRCGRIRRGSTRCATALARTLKLDPAAISVKHVQGPGCYGHNGADDAAADAAVIAFRRPGQPIRVRWRREEEFGFEPVSPAMVVTCRAALDGPDARPTGPPRSGAAGTRAGPGGGGNLLAAEALPDPPPHAARRRSRPIRPAPAPATASRSTISRRSASSIT